MADLFIKQEETNFSLFNSVARLNKEVERVETEVYDLQGELDKLEHKQRFRNNDGATDKTQTAMRELEEKRAKTTSALQEATKESKKLRHELSEVMKIVDNVVKEILEVDLTNDYSYLFSGNDGGQLSEQNLIQVMGVIEEKVTEIVIAK